MVSIINLTHGDDYGVYVTGRRNPANGLMLLFRGTFAEVIAWRRCLR